MFLGYITGWPTAFWYAQAARVGNSAGATYLKSLKNSWRLDPKSKKDYMNFTTDDWEEDVLNYIQNKR